MSQIVYRDVSYVHDSQEIGKSKLYDKFSLKLLEENKDIWFRVIVRPIDDYPPQVFFKTKLSVLEGKEATLTTDQITIIDKDTADNDIICFVTAPPLFGILNNTFTYKDILDNSVLYIQSVHRKIEQTDDSFSLACHDKYNNSRNNFGSIPIEIVPVNDEPPVVTANNITDKRSALSRVLTICDMDTPLDKLTISIVRPPSKGIISKNYGNAITNFTFASLSEVHYENWESGQDSFILAISDGTFTTEVIVRVSINELPPTLIVNEGLDLNVGKTELITSKQLFAEDKDTQANDVIYVIKHAPMYGSLYLNKTELYPGFKFNQNDITSELISYTHSDHTSFMDVFVFDLTDGIHTLFNENFFITIRDYNVSYKVTSRSPIIASNTSITLNEHLLNVNNINEEKNKVTFLIMTQPKHGRVEYKSEPGQSIQTFTLRDLYEHNLQYVHLKNTSATEIIQLEVNFGQHPIFHSFTIIIQSNEIAEEDFFTSKPLQDTTETSRPELIYSKPIKILNQLENSDGQLGVIINSGSLLSQDTEGYDVVYNVTDPPKFGYLYNNNIKSKCNLFTQDDINNDLIYYYLNEDERSSTEDSFEFDIIGHNSVIRGITFNLYWTWVNFKTSEIFIDGVGEFKVEIEREGHTLQNAFIELEIDESNSTSDYYLEKKEVYFSPGQILAHTILHITKNKLTDELESVVLAIKKVENLVKRTPDKLQLLFPDNYSNNEGKFSCKMSKIF
uniref:Cadherin domain-containing protein n=1 Tax=Rhodnius prolixus TaxID=13249 RepID=A0A905R0P5_RHOPR